MHRDDLRYDVIIVGGFGHVGLPLGITLADGGFQVALYDIDQRKRPIIEAGHMPFLEHDAEPILKRVIGKTLHVVTNVSEVAQADVLLITVGTPIDEYLNPKLRPILNLAEQFSGYLRPGHCVILRSTVFPGTTNTLNEFLKQRGLHVHVAYCPERIVQGYAIRELRTLPQVISGFTEPAIECAERIFRRLGVETIVVSVQEAELVRLFTNAWRYIQFAIANQFYTLALEQGVDFERIYLAMTHNYKRGQDMPRPGFAAGPCLLKDTLQLAAFYENQFQLGHAAMMINEGLPNFIVKHLKTRLKLNLRGTRVGILGMAFKADSDDIRDSLSYKLAKILKFHGAQVICSDEYVKDPTFVTKEELIAACPVVVVGVPHTAYRDLAIPAETHFVDLWGVVQRRPQEAVLAGEGTGHVSEIGRPVER